MKKEILEELAKDFYSDDDEMMLRIAFKRGYTECEERRYSEEDMINFAWFLIKNVGQYSCDRTAHFEGKYLEQFKKN
jgi:hypothetical protein